MKLELFAATLLTFLVFEAAVLAQQTPRPDTSTKLASPTRKIPVPEQLEWESTVVEAAKSQKIENMPLPPSMRSRAAVVQPPVVNLEKPVFKFSAFRPKQAEETAAVRIQDLPSLELPESAATLPPKAPDTRPKSVKTIDLASPGFLHRRLHFAERDAERDGCSPGEARQAVRSGVRFYSRAALLPVRMLFRKTR